MMKALMLAALLCGAPAVADAAEVAGWSFTTHRDPMYDTSTHAAVRRGDHGVLAIMCQSGRGGFRVTIGSDEMVNPLGGTTVRNVMYRFDTDEPTEARWNYLGQYGALVESSGVFVTMLNVAQRLVVRLYDHNGQPVDVAFSLTGASAALRELSTRCGM